MGGCAKFGIYGFAILMFVGVVSAMCQGVAATFGIVTNDTSRQSATSSNSRLKLTDDLSQEITFPVTLRSSDGWEFVITNVSTIASIETSAQRFRPENGVFAIFMGELRNYTDKNDCLKGNEFEAEADGSRISLNEDLLPQVQKRLDGLDFPGFFMGQCLDYDQSAPSFIFFDVPDDKIVKVHMKDAVASLGIIRQTVAQVAKATPIAQPTSASPTASIETTLAAKPLAASETKLQSVIPTNTPDSSVSSEERALAPTENSTPEPVSTPRATSTEGATYTPTSTATPTATQTPTSSATPTDTPSPTPAPITGVSNADANLRGGPGTEFEIVGSLPANIEVIIVGSNQAGEWYQLASGQWVAGFLVGTLSAPLPTLPPTATPLPTDTPAPTKTPRPTPTPRPAAPTCAEVRQVFAGATGAQWKAYSEDVVRGTWIDGWSGWIDDVEDWSILAWGYPLWVNFDQDCRAYVILKSENTALKYSVGQEISMTAQVDFINEIWGTFTFHVDDDTVRIR